MTLSSQVLRDESVSASFLNSRQSCGLIACRYAVAFDRSAARSFLADPRVVRQMIDASLLFYIGNPSRKMPHRILSACPAYVQTRAGATPGMWCGSFRAEGFPNSCYGPVSDAPSFRDWSQIIKRCPVFFTGSFVSMLFLSTGHAYCGRSGTDFPGNVDRSGCSFTSTACKVHLYISIIQRASSKKASKNENFMNAAGRFFMTPRDFHA